MHTFPISHSVNKAFWVRAFEILSNAANAPKYDDSLKVVHEGFSLHADTEVDVLGVFQKDDTYIAVSCRWDSSYNDILKVQVEQATTVSQLLSLSEGERNMLSLIGF